MIQPNPEPLAATWRSGSGGLTAWKHHGLVSFSADALRAHTHRLRWFKQGPWLLFCKDHPVSLVNLIAACPFSLSSSPNGLQAAWLTSHMELCRPLHPNSRRVVCVRVAFLAHSKVSCQWKHAVQWKPSGSKLVSTKQCENPPANLKLSNLSPGRPNPSMLSTPAVNM